MLRDRIYHITYFIPPHVPEEKAHCGPACPEIFPPQTQAHAQTHHLSQIRRVETAQVINLCFLVVYPTVITQLLTHN